MNRLLAYLEGFHPLSDGLRAYLMEHLTPVSFPNRHILLDVPRIASHVYFLVDGFAMSYSYHRHGKITESFCKPGQFIVAFESFMYQKPSFEVIQLVKPSDLLCFSNDAMVKMLEKFPEAYRILYSMMDRHCNYVRKRLRVVKSYDHEGQYQKLLTIFPGIEGIVSQRAIATYLGITPQSLARIKRRIK